LKAYVRSDHFASRVHQRPELSTPAQPALLTEVPFDVKLLLVDLGRSRNPVDETRRRLLALAAESPTRPEPYAQLGYLDWKATGGAAAAVWFDKAYAAGERSPQLLWDYGRLSASREPKRAAGVFSQLLALEPTRQEARLELAALQLAINKPNDAIHTLGTGPWPADATPRALSIVATAELKRNHLAAAKSAVERLLACASTAEYRELAQRLLTILH
jgi:hypothetical protein